METHRALWVDMDVISWDWIKVVLGGCRPDHTIRRRGHDIGSSNGQWARQTGTRNDPGTKYGQRTDRGARCGSACRARASTRHTTYCHIDIGPDQVAGKLPAIGHTTCCGRGEESAPPIHPFQCLSNAIANVYTKLQSLSHWKGHQRAAQRTAGTPRTTC